MAKTKKKNVAVEQGDSKEAVLKQGLPQENDSSTNEPDTPQPLLSKRQLSRSTSEDPWDLTGQLKLRRNPNAIPGEPSSIQEDATLKDVSGVCWSRKGRALRKQTILKCDHTSWIWKKDLQQPLTQAPNFRRFGAAGGALPVFGVAQPTQDGCAEVLAEIQRIEPGLHRILWFTLRDELVIYINGRPYCVRDRRNPSEYAPQAGCQPQELQDLEEMLKREILEEAEQQGDRILLHGERGDRELYAYWEPLGKDVGEIRCQHELFQELQEYFPELRFARFPITDNHAPEEKDFDALAEELIPELRATQRKCAVVFNCLMGQGRTTTGMVLSSLLCQVVALGTGAPDPTCIPDVSSYKGKLEPALISDIVGRLEHGGVARRWVDSVMDECEHMMNLRKCVVDKKRLMDRQRDWTEWAKLKDKYTSFTERYVYLVLFGHYLWSEVKDGAGDFPKNSIGFQKHMRDLQSTVSIYELFEGLEVLGWESRRLATRSSNHKNSKSQEAMHGESLESLEWETVGNASESSDQKNSSNQQATHRKSNNARYAEEHQHRPQQARSGNWKGEHQHRPQQAQSGKGKGKSASNNSKTWQGDQEPGNAQ